MLIAFAVTLAILSRTAWSCSMQMPCKSLGAGAVFAEPLQEKSQSSSWSTTLTVDIGTKVYNWLEINRRMFNGQITGPTITVKQGDKLFVTLDNKLSSSQDTTIKPNKPKTPNTTNIHTHGLHISSQGKQDNVLTEVAPGTSFQYEYEIHDDQPAGTYWYHSHWHGSTNFQVHGGLSGMLIVEDPPGTVSESISSFSCPNNCDNDIQLLFQPILMFKGERGFGGLQDEIKDDPIFRHDDYIVTDGTTLTKWLQKEIDYFTTNGQVQPELTMTKGQIYRFRMVNAGGNHTLELYIVDNLDNAACTIREIAWDGIYLDAPRTMNSGQSMLEPAGRVDWLVKCDKPGTYYIKSYPNPNNRLSIGDIFRYNEKLVTLKVSSTMVSTSQAFPNTLPKRPDFLADLSRLTQDQINGQFVVELNPSTYLNREKWRSDYYRYKMPVGSVQEWFFTNTDIGGSHPIHTHVNHFQVTSWNAYTGSYAVKKGNNFELFDVENLTYSCDYQSSEFEPDDAGGGVEVENPLEFLGHDKRYSANAGNTLGYARVGDWRDVVMVPPLANLSVRFRVHEFVGDVIIHCHFLHHEDTGMMLAVEAVSDGADTTAHTRSGNAYPGTCRSCDRYPFNNPQRLCDIASAASIVPTKMVLLTTLLVHLLVFFVN